MGKDADLYLISGRQIKDLAKGRLKPEDLAIPENLALVRWSGAAVARRIPRQFKWPKGDDMEALVKGVIESMDSEEYSSAIIENTIVELVEGVKGRELRTRRTKKV